MSDDPDLESAYALKTPEDNKRLYRKWAETYDADFVTGTTFRHPDVVARMYVEAGGRWPCLDVGCGTGVMAEKLPPQAVLDGIDISPEMLSVARRKGRYRNLLEADLTQPLDLPDATYAGLVSTGTFTHGHVGPEALSELVRVLAPGALAVIGVRPEVWVEKGFEVVFDALVSDLLVSTPSICEEAVYADAARAPDGHADDTGYIVTFQRL